MSTTRIRKVGIIAVVTVLLVITGCIDGPRMLTQSDRVPEIEGGKWCKLDAKALSLIGDCYAFEWRGSYYYAGGSLYGFKKVGDGKFIGEYVELDGTTGEPKFKFWPKVIAKIDDPKSRMVNLGYEADHFNDFERVAEYYADARGATLSFEVGEFDDTWYLQGSSYAIRQVLTDLVDHLNPENARYFKLVDGVDTPNSYPMQLANIAKGTTEEVFVAEYICFSGVKHAQEDQIVLAEIPEIERIFEACEAIQGLKQREHAALGGLLWTGQKIPDADIHFRKAVESPDSQKDITLRHETLHKWGAMHFNEENYSEVIQILSMLLDEDAKHLGALQYRGLSYRRLNDHSNAIADYTATIEVAEQLNQPLEIAIAYMRRGYVHQLEGRLDDAQRDNLIALQLEPKLNYAHSNLGAIAEQRGDIAAARKHYEKALELNKDNTHAQDGLKRIN